MHREGLPQERTNAVYAGADIVFSHGGAAGDKLPDVAQISITVTVTAVTAVTVTGNSGISADFHWISPEISKIGCTQQSTGSIQM